MGNKTSCESSLTTVSEGNSDDDLSSVQDTSKMTILLNERPRTSPVPTNPSKAMKIALDFVKAKNNKDLIKLYTVCSSDAMFHFVDINLSMPMRTLWDGLMGMFQALPDISFSYTHVTEIEPNVIVYENYAGAGHHTGILEYTGHPDIPPTGAYISDDPMTLTLWIDLKEQKIIKVTAKTNNGGLAGPYCFYKKALMITEKQKKQQQQEKKQTNKKRTKVVSNAA